MALDLGQRILQREISSTLSRRRAIRDLYGHRGLVQELDIVNELEGHTGCVNALSWSKSGRLLASGSDDQHLNIHVYQPENTDKQFQLQTTVATGHTQNIFSVKFMPHSDDRTVITCAGDGEVRVFDLEHSGVSTEASAAANRASTRRRARRTSSFNGVRYKTDGDTNARVYRSHGDRVKRIVTESSPYHFLTCSEDGEVRHWDIRQPSSAYPRPGNNGNVPPPLISYSRYNLDLNTISCSASQPHYIALGGAHLHCFLHDRRMTGRDRLKESGRLGQSRTQRGDELRNEATRCVRKFAPQGQPHMTDDCRGHITACKISDARPNELIASWSGDHIYAFDLVRSPDAGDTIEQQHQPGRELKRKRRSAKSSSGQDEITAVRIRYGNGQSEDITVNDDGDRGLSREHLTHEQIQAQELTKAILKTRALLASKSEDEEDKRQKFAAILQDCEHYLQRLDQVLRQWTYPMNPSQHQLDRERKLRKIREKARRCLQAAGVISRLVLGTAVTDLNANTGEALDMVPFMWIDNLMSEIPLSSDERFTFDLIKAICAWLDAGIGNLIDSFTRPHRVSPTSKLAARLPIPNEDTGPEAVDMIISYLLEQLPKHDSLPIIDPEANEFLLEENRRIFATGEEAIQKFKSAVEQGFADLSSSGDEVSGIERADAVQFWAFKVARSLLLQAFDSIGPHLEVALGGIRTIVPKESDLGNGTTALVDAPEEVSITDADDQDMPDHAAAHAFTLRNADADGDGDDSDDNDDNDHDSYDYDDIDTNDERNEMESENDYDYEDSSSDPDEEDGVPNLGMPAYMRAAAERRRRKGSVAASVPCNSALRSYKGHCNVRTVKDVNYFGLEDEYVVSGSDDGNVFIWDQRTGELVNILEGDGEVVNVVQGHPYETMLAVSGIDDTIKIFSPDHNAREVARLGRQVTAQDPSTFSSIGLGRRGRASQPSQPSLDNGRAVDMEDDDFVSATGLRSRRRMQEADDIIDNNNTAGRRRGDDNAVITTSMLRLVAQRMRAQRMANGGDPNVPLDGFDMEEDELGRMRLVVRDDCILM